MGRFDLFPIFIAIFASRRVTLIATHSKSQKQTRLPIRYLYFILPFKPLINKEVIKVFQNYINYRYNPYRAGAKYGRHDKRAVVMSPVLKYYVYCCLLLV